LRELASRTVDAAVVSKEVWERAQAAGEVEPEALRSIYRSAPLPFFAWGVPHDLAPELVPLVVEAFVSFPWQGSPLELEFREAEGTRFVPTQYARDWAEVRRLLERPSASP
jgi:phosphonate transport system substrate-binding protein